MLEQLNNLSDYMKTHFDTKYKNLIDTIKSYLENNLKNEIINEINKDQIEMYWNNYK